MGCTQTSASVIPYNQLPIKQSYNNEGYSTIKPSPVVIITAPPIPSYVKSALKKPYRDRTGKTRTLSVLTRKTPSLNRQVNFDEKVLVKPRTPTPNKIWYEKASSTMPMRKHPCNDDDDYDYDYDYDQIASISSDEEQVNDEQMDTQSQISTGGLLQQNQPNNVWYKTNSRGHMSLTNTMPENESFPPTTLQSSFNVNTYTAPNPIVSPVNRIKVRRKIPNLDPPRMSFSPSYQRPPQSPDVLFYQSSTQSSAIPAYQISAQTPNVSLHQSSTVRPFQTPTVPFYHSAVSFQTPIVSSIQSPVQRFSHTSQVKRTLPSINGESSSETPYYPYSRRPIETVT